jgi:hypothetical protein
LLSKNKEKSTLLILTDAFSKAYFSTKETPFLHDISRDGIVTHVKPLFAFKGIETTIFTGLWPKDHNVWTEFCFADELIDKKGRLFQAVTAAADLLPNDMLNSRARYVLGRYIFHFPHSTPSLIPAASLPYFFPSQEKQITEPGALGNINTIFDVFRKERIKYEFIEPGICGDWGVLSKVKKLIKQGHKTRFWYLKFNILDHVGHKFGPSPILFKESMKKIDTYIKDVVALLQRKNPNLNILILADHGMSKVYKTVNLFKELKQLNSRMYTDYLVFLDSTIARFCFLTKKAEKEICEHLYQIEEGHIITNSEKQLLQMPSDLKYGEVIFAIDEGCILHPCFFHSRTRVNGMHGYAYTKTDEALPIMIMNNQISQYHQPNVKYTYRDIARLITDSLLSDSSSEFSIFSR